MLPIQIIRASFSAHKGADLLLLDANCVYDELKVNPTLHNILMSIPPSTEPAALMHSITSFYFSNESHVLTPINDLICFITTCTLRKRRQSQKIQDIFKSIFAGDEAISSY